MGESSGSPCQPCTPEWSKSLSRELEDVINRWDRGNIINNKYHVVIKIWSINKIKPINNEYSYPFLLVCSINLVNPPPHLHSPNCVHP